MPTATFSVSFGCTRGVRDSSDGDELDDDDLHSRGGVVAMYASKRRFRDGSPLTHVDTMSVCGTWSLTRGAASGTALRVGVRMNWAIIAAAAGHMLAFTMHRAIMVKGNMVGNRRGICTWLTCTRHGLEPKWKREALVRASVARAGQTTSKGWRFRMVRRMVRSPSANSQHGDLTIHGGSFSNWGW